MHQHYAHMRINANKLYSLGHLFFKQLGPKLFFYILIGPARSPWTSLTQPMIKYRPIGPGFITYRTPMQTYHQITLFMTLFFILFCIIFFVLNYWSRKI